VDLTKELTQAEETAPESTCEKVRRMPAADIRHNMIVCIMLDAIFLTGYNDLQIALQPMYVFLKASDTVIGFIGSLQILGVIGVLAAPFITRRFKYKKYYLFAINVPFLAPVLVMGLALLFSRQLGWSNAAILGFVKWSMVVHFFFLGFGDVPHQEYTASCIPMSHRGRYTGYSLAVGSAAAILSALIARHILLNVGRPMSFGLVYIVAWVICQGGYVSALFAREPPTPVEKSPAPWSKAMLLAVWRDRPFVKFLVLNVLFAVFVIPLWVFIPVYGFRDLKMIAASAATMAIVTQIVRVATSAPIGLINDRLGSKRMLPFWPLVGFASILPVLLIHNQYGIYISVGITGIFTTGFYSALYPLAYGLPAPENRAGHFTILSLTNKAAPALGMFLVGAMCDLLTYRVVFIISAGICLALCPFSKYMTSSFKDKAEDYG